MASIDATKYQTQFNWVAGYSDTPPTPICLYTVPYPQHVLSPKFNPMSNLWIKKSTYYPKISFHHLLGIIISLEKLYAISSGNLTEAVYKLKHNKTWNIMKVIKTHNSQNSIEQQKNKNYMKQLNMGI